MQNHPRLIYASCRPVRIRENSVNLAWTSNGNLEIGTEHLQLHLPHHRLHAGLFTRVTNTTLMLLVTGWHNSGGWTKSCLPTHLGPRQPAWYRSVSVSNPGVNKSLLLPVQYCCPHQIHSQYNVKAIISCELAEMLNILQEVIYKGPKWEFGLVNTVCTVLELPVVHSFHGDTLASVYFRRRIVPYN